MPRRLQSTGSSIHLSKRKICPNYPSHRFVTVMSGLIHNWIAWCPSFDPELVELGAVLCHPEQKLDRNTYLCLVGERIQRIVDAAEDPVEATHELEKSLFEYGLGPDLSCPPENAGNWLVWSNPGVEEYLANKGLLEGLRNKKPKEMAVAREVIEGDAENDDAIGWLQMWAWRLSQIP
jgi:hypothetical protein